MSSSVIISFAHRIKQAAANRRNKRNREQVATKMCPYCSGSGQCTSLGSPIIQRRCDVCGGRGRIPL